MKVIPAEPARVAKLLFTLALWIGLGRVHDHTMVEVGHAHTHVMHEPDNIPELRGCVLEREMIVTSTVL